MIKFKKYFYVTVLVLMQAAGTKAFALSEEMLGTHKGEIIPQKILANLNSFDQLQTDLSQTGVAELDQLWNSRQDIKQGLCDATENDCRILSVFRGTHSDHPVAMLPGFTGYRKMYLEEIYDLLQAGYGPIYIVDLSGTGDSYKPELRPGQKEPSFDELLKSQNKKVKAAVESHFNSIAPKENLAEIRKTLGGLPIGLGHINDFKDYEIDIDFLMSAAIAENPAQKILITSLSQTGLNVMLALAVQAKTPTWISHVDRILLESPMLRVKGVDKLGRGTGFITEIAGKLGEIFVGSQKPLDPSFSMQEFFDKALGHFNPDNHISHSANRITLTDSIRVWNLHETAGATFGWAYEDLSKQYAISGLDSLPGLMRPLNVHTKAIARVLAKNNIVLVAVISKADEVVDPEATQKFMRDLIKNGYKDGNLCVFQTARHVIDQESDRYREPFMSLVLDQKEASVKSSYGTEPQNEILQCGKP